VQGITGIKKQRFCPKDNTFVYLGQDNQKIIAILSVPLERGLQGSGLHSSYWLRAGNIPNVLLLRVNTDDPMIAYVKMPEDDVTESAPASAG
jgi:hypothetical protein